MAFRFKLSPTGEKYVQSIREESAKARPENAELRAALRLFDEDGLLTGFYIRVADDDPAGEEFDFPATKVERMAKEATIAAGEAK